MSPAADDLAQKLLNNPEEFLPAAAVRHVKNAQAELSQAMAEISKYADPEYVKNNPEEFKKMYQALYPAISSSTDFNKQVLTTLNKNLQDYQTKNLAPAIKLEKELTQRRGLKERDIMNIRTQVMDKIQGMIRGNVSSDRISPVAAIPAAVAAGAAVVAAVVEVVTLVRSVTSSSVIDRIIRTERLNPSILAIQHAEILKTIKTPNVLRGRGGIR